MSVQSKTFKCQYVRGAQLSQGKCMFPKNMLESHAITAKADRVQY